MRQKKSVEDNHGDALTEDNTYGNNLFSLIFSEYYSNGCKTWVAQKPENAGLKKKMSVSCKMTTCQLRRKR